MMLVLPERAAILETANSRRAFLHNDRACPRCAPARRRKRGWSARLDDRGAFATYGAHGVGGVAALAIGSLMPVDTNVPAFRLSLSVVVAMTPVAENFLLLVLSMLIRAWRRLRLGRFAARLEQPRRQQGLKLRS